MVPLHVRHGVRCGERRAAMDGPQVVAHNSYNTMRRKLTYWSNIIQNVYLTKLVLCKFCIVSLWQVSPASQASPHRLKKKQLKIMPHYHPNPGRSNKRWPLPGDPYKFSINPKPFAILLAALFPPPTLGISTVAQAAVTHTTKHSKWTSTKAHQMMQASNAMGRGSMDFSFDFIRLILCAVGLSYVL